MPAPTKTKEELYKELIKHLNYLTKEDLDFLGGVYSFAVAAHGNQVRKTGEAYICHPLRTALELTLLKMDMPTIAAGILHDTIEDTGTTEETLKNNLDLK